MRISFPSANCLKIISSYLEEAKKRDHKIFGPKLDLFSLKEEAPGMPFIHPKGMIIWNRLLDFLRIHASESRLCRNQNASAHEPRALGNIGHWFHYRENMYAFSIEDRDFAIKPMNCPGCMLFYKTHTHSYRELPLRVAEIGHVHRHEASGALSGLVPRPQLPPRRCPHFHAARDIKREILDMLSACRRNLFHFGLDLSLGTFHTS